MLKVNKTLLESDLNFTRSDYEFYTRVEQLPRTEEGDYNRLELYLERTLINELTASVLYRKLSHKLEELEDSKSEELLRHSDQEYQHFCKIMDYATRVGLSCRIKYKLNEELEYPVTTKTDLFNLVQTLEYKSILDYRFMIETAKKYSLRGLIELLTPILDNEIDHLKDFKDESNIGRDFLGETEKIRDLEALEEIEDTKKIDTKPSEVQKTAVNYDALESEDDYDPDFFEHLYE